MALASKRCLITGGSRGIGLAIAQRFASLGASTVLLSKSHDRLASATSSLPRTVETQEHSFITGDVGDAQLWEDVKRREKSIDILVNAAGITQSSLLVATKTSSIEDIVRTNLLGTILACRALGRNMVRQKSGCIINISSLLALHKPTPGSSAYAASKAGITGLTRSLAAEFAPSNIRTNVIVPGYIETDMTAAMNDVATKQALEKTPLGRFGTVEEVADAAEFLVKCGFVNGAEIVVDGGLGST